LQSRQSLHSGFKQELETYIKVLSAALCARLLAGRSFQNRKPCFSKQDFKHIAAVFSVSGAFLDSISKSDAAAQSVAFGKTQSLAEEIVKPENEVADSRSAGFACKRKQSLHSRCNKSPPMNTGLRKRGDGPVILTGWRDHAGTCI